MGTGIGNPHHREPLFLSAGPERGGIRSRGIQLNPLSFSRLPRILSRRPAPKSRLSLSRSPLRKPPRFAARTCVRVATVRSIACPTSYSHMGGPPWKTRKQGSAVRYSTHKVQQRCDHSQPVPCYGRSTPSMRDVLSLQLVPLYREYCTVLYCTM